MADQVYRIVDLRDRVIAFLRTQEHGAKAGFIATSLQLPLWAVFHGLDAALEGKYAVLVAGHGYFAAENTAKIFVAMNTTTEG